MKNKFSKGPKAPNVKKNKSNLESKFYFKDGIDSLTGTSKVDHFVAESYSRLDPSSLSQFPSRDLAIGRFIVPGSTDLILNYSREDVIDLPGIWGNSITPKSVSSLNLTSTPTIIDSPFFNSIAKDADMQSFFDRLGGQLLAANSLSKNTFLTFQVNYSGMPNNSTTSDTYLVGKDDSDKIWSIIIGGYAVSAVNPLTII